jgi:hypothetical protein
MVLRFERVVITNRDDSRGRGCDIPAIDGCGPDHAGVLLLGDVTSAGERVVLSVVRKSLDTMTPEVASDVHC